MPARLQAGHGLLDWESIEPGTTCYSCHTLDAARAAEAAAASHLDPLARGGIFSRIRAAGGGTGPGDVGCVFCHNNPGNARMRGVLDHFAGTGWLSRHPVGVDWVTGIDNDREYRSSLGSRDPDGLDCVDCHDPALLAPDGSPAGHGGPLPPSNPTMLRATTVRGEHDELCRRCHRSDDAVDVAGKGRKIIRLESHADGAAGRPILEADGTPLKTTVAGGGAQCTRCHDTHASTKVRLLNDGHEGDPPIAGGDCVTICHYPGDADGYADDTARNTWVRGGHGRAASTYKYLDGRVDYASGSYRPMGLACDDCHLPLDTDTGGPSRVRHAAPDPGGATNAERYARRHHLSLPVRDEGEGSVGGHPARGVCANCHEAYEPHLADGGALVVGCQDCHDEHGEGVGTGAGANVFMIPLSSRPAGSFAPRAARPRPGAERVAHDTTRLDPATGRPRTDGSIDLYRADGHGVCDNTECHGATSTPARPGPLATFFAGGWHAQAGPQRPGADCEACHRHEGGAAGTGSWGADPVGCGTCHDHPGAPRVAGAHPLSPPHDRHAGSPAGPAGGKGYACDVCHQGAQHNDAGSPGGVVADGSEWAAKVAPDLNARVQVRFDPAWNPGTGPNPAAASADSGSYNDATNACANTYCHGATLGAQGAVPAPAWAGTLACGSCHAESSATLVSGSHAAHLQTATGGGTACADCHPAYNLAPGGTHADGTVTFNRGIGYGGAAGDRLPAVGRGGCGTNRCHNDGRNGPPLVSSYSWGTAIGGVNSCAECHAATSALATDSHDEHLPAAANLGGAGGPCAVCHAAATVATHGDGTVDLAGPAEGYPAAARVVGVPGSGSCGTNRCHNGGDGVAPPAAPSYPWGTSIPACTACHGATTATVTSGSHAAHFDAVWGARIGSCSACHTAATAGAHPDGTVTMLAAATGAAPSDLDGTAVCNPCHGIAAYTNERIKANWARVAPNTYAGAGADVTCESCHGGGDTLAWQNADGSGARAPMAYAHFLRTGHGMASGSYEPSGNPAARLTCLDCHDSASAHLDGAPGSTDRLSAPGNALCARCHGAAGEGVRASTHGNRPAGGGGSPASRPAFELDCVECHDPHGSGNIFMIGAKNPDGPLSAERWYGGRPDAAAFLYRGVVNFFDDSAGASPEVGVGFADTAPNASKICTTCHTDTGGVYEHDGATAGHGTGACTACHPHDADGDAATQDGFMPLGACPTCHDGSRPPAPNVMRYWSGSTAQQDGGHGDPNGRDAWDPPSCEDCHDIADPPGTHLDGVVNSVFDNRSRNGNTAHLLPAFFERTAPPPLEAGDGEWRWQVRFDNYCAYSCHIQVGTKVRTRVPDMRHEQDTIGEDKTPGNVSVPGGVYKRGDDPPDHWAVTMGTHLTAADGDSLPRGRTYPMDRDLTTRAEGGADHAPCVACHDPHGTGTVDPRRPTNVMIRDPWSTAPPVLCLGCHE